MKLMNIKVIYPYLNTSKPDSNHQNYPYYSGCRHKQSQSSMVNRYYRTGDPAIFQWKRVLCTAWRLLTGTLQVFYIGHYLTPQKHLSVLRYSNIVLLIILYPKYLIAAVNRTDQDIQFTANMFLDVLIEKQIKISMDGKDGWPLPQSIG